jgi:DNA polymerase III subunit delta'
MRDVVGQEQVVGWLQSAVKQKRLAHAYLFTDSNMEQTKQMAIQLAKLLNCEQGGKDACDICSTCIQIEHGNHPDVVAIQPDGAYIKIDQVRAVQATFRYRAPDHIQRVLIIEAAEKMRLETANSLLKFLEEPISPMIAILLTDKKERILPTIQSRCQWVRFTKPELNIRRELFVQKGFDETIANILASLQYQHDYVHLESEEIAQLVEKITNWSQAFLKGDEVALFDVQVGWLVEELELKRGKGLLEILLLWLKELIKRENSLFVNQLSLKQKICTEIPEEMILLALENVMIASRLIQKQEISASAILEQMILATQERRKSKQDDWHLIVI